ncbi:hypothetical protein K502DRAFT_52652 [Neoconidiobolus thromboides FSU 785]|nr:hypothetical protein K502DRAFT_52652 [Neoconidiobolus thromboides FSU 785]
MDSDYKESATDKAKLKEVEKNGNYLSKLPESVLQESIPITGTPDEQIFDDSFVDVSKILKDFNISTEKSFINSLVSDVSFNEDSLKIDNELHNVFGFGERTPSTAPPISDVSTPSNISRLYSTQSIRESEYGVNDLSYMSSIHKSENYYSNHSIKPSEQGLNNQGHISPLHNDDYYLGEEINVVDKAGLMEDQLNYETIKDPSTANYNLSKNINKEFKNNDNIYIDPNSQYNSLSYNLIQESIQNDNSKTNSISSKSPINSNNAFDLNPGDSPNLHQVSFVNKDSNKNSQSNVYPKNTITPVMSNEISISKQVVDEVNNNMASYTTEASHKEVFLPEVEPSTNNSSNGNVLVDSAYTTEGEVSERMGEIENQEVFSSIETEVDEKSDFSSIHEENEKSLTDTGSQEEDIDELTFSNINSVEGSNKIDGMVKENQESINQFSYLANEEVAISFQEEESKISSIVHNLSLEKKQEASIQIEDNIYSIEAGNEAQVEDMISEQIDDSIIQISNNNIEKRLKETALDINSQVVKEIDNILDTQNMNRTDVEAHYFDDIEFNYSKLNLGLQRNDDNIYPLTPPDDNSDLNSLSKIESLIQDINNLLSDKDVDMNLLVEPSLKMPKRTFEKYEDKENEPPTSLLDMKDIRFKSSTNPSSSKGMTTYR